MAARQMRNAVVSVFPSTNRLARARLELTVEPANAVPDCLKTRSLILYLVRWKGHARQPDGADAGCDHTRIDRIVLTKLLSYNREHPLAAGTIATHAVAKEASGSRKAQNDERHD
jgi:hypothetical protein